MGRAPVPVSLDDKNMSWAPIPVCGIAEYGIGPVNLILRSNLVSRGVVVFGLVGLGQRQLFSLNGIDLGCTECLHCLGMEWIVWTDCTCTCVKCML